jgi:hypothetical protein
MKSSFHSRTLATQLTLSCPLFSFIFYCRLKRLPQFYLYSPGADPTENTVPVVRPQQYLDCCLLIRCRGTSLPSRCLSKNVYSGFQASCHVINWRGLSYLVRSAGARSALCSCKKVVPSLYGGTLHFAWYFSANRLSGSSLKLCLCLNFELIYIKEQIGTIISRQWSITPSWKHISLWKIIFSIEVEIP